MKRLTSTIIFSLLALILVVWAAGDTVLEGTVWFVPDHEEAPCVIVRLYGEEDCQDMITSTLTDTCGWYSIGGISAPCSIWVELDFDTNRACVDAGWTGTCPSTVTPCELVYIPDQPWVNKDWDPNLDDCDNVGCNE